MAFFFFLFFFFFKSFPSLYFFLSISSFYSVFKTEKPSESTRSRQRARLQYLGHFPNLTFNINNKIPEFIFPEIVMITIKILVMFFNIVWKLWNIINIHQKCHSSWDRHRFRSDSLSRPVDAKRFDRKIRENKQENELQDIWYLQRLFLLKNSLAV